MWWTAPAPGIDVHRVIVRDESLEGAVHMQVTTIGIDLPKNVFQVHADWQPASPSIGGCCADRQLLRQ
jgi:hypothetical protein